MKKSDHLWNRNGVYYFRAKLAGELISRSLGPISKESAVKKARELYKLEAEKRWEILESNKMRDTYSLLSDVFAAYRDATARKGDPRPETAEHNIRALVRIVRVVDGNLELDVGTARASVLTEELIENYARIMLDAIDDNQVLEDRARRSIASMVRQARSLFAKHTRTIYRGLHLPDLDGFLKADIGRIPLKRFVLPPKQLRTRTIEESAKLAQTNPALYAGYCLCYHMGLRSSEATACRWDWFEVKDDGRVFLHVIDRPQEGFRTKGYAGTVPVPVEVWKQLEATRSDANPYVLSGPNKTARENLIARDLAKWMRDIGWDRETYLHCAHNLRALIGSLWRKKYGIEGARERLRHAQVQTTVDFYAGLDYEDLEALEVANVA